MDEMAASSSRWRATLAFSFSAARFSVGAAFSVAFGGIVFSCNLGLFIAGWVELVKAAVSDWQQFSLWQLRSTTAERGCVRSTSRSASEFRNVADYSVALLLSYPLRLVLL